MIQEFKEVDVGWIKEIPKEWEIKKVKEVYEFVSEKVSDTEYPALTVSSKYGITPQMEHVAKTLNGDSRKRVEKGDFVINSRADRPGACGISAYDGSVSMICHVLKPRNKEMLHEKYMHYLFRNNMFSQEFFRWGRGIVSDLWSTRKDEFGSLQLPIPPIKDQKIIGNYLEYKERALNELILLKEQQLEKLEQQRQSIITEAVTKGLNPNVKMKESGVEWIGEIPEHWEASKLKNMFILQRGHDLTHEQFNKGIVPVYASNGIMGYHDLITTKGPNVTVGRSGSVGKVNYVECDFWAHNTCIYVKDSKKNNMKYIYYILKSLDMGNLSTQTAVPTLDRKNIQNSMFVYTLDIEEQREIVIYLDRKLDEIETTIGVIEKQINSLKEYRQALIYEAVTGKIDVRDMELD